MDDTRTPMPGYILKTKPDGRKLPFDIISLLEMNRLIDFWDKTYEVDHKRRIKIAVKSAMRDGKFSVEVDGITNPKELESLRLWLIDEEGLPNVVILKRLSAGPDGLGGTHIGPRPYGLHIEWVEEK